MYPDGEHYIDIFNLKASALGKKIMKDNKYDPLQMKWIRSFDNVGLDDVGYDLIVDEKNEILILGTTENKKNRRDDIWFLKLNENGKMIWNREMGDTLHERLLSMNETDKNHFIAVGKNQFDNDTIKSKAWIVGADFDGSNAWNRNLEARNLNTLVSYSSQDFIVGGSYFENDSIEKMYLAKVRKDGKTSWQRYYSMNSEINELVVTDSFDIIAAGSNYIFSVNKDGYINWEKLLEDSSMIKNIDISANYVYFTEVKKDSSYSINKIDTDGNELWSKQISFKDRTTINDLAVLQNEEMLLSCIQNEDVLLLYLNSEGEIAKETYFGTPDYCLIS